MSMLKMDNEKSEHLLDDYHAYHFPRATYTEVGGLLQPAALPQSTEKLATEFSTQNHKTNQPTEEVCTYNLITVWSCLFHCPSYLFALVFLNTSSSLLMSATFIFLNYSRNLQTWSFPMAWIISPILNPLDLHFSPPNDLMNSASFIIATWGFTQTTFSWISHGPKSVNMSFIMLNLVIANMIGFDPVELVLCILPLLISVWMMCNWVLAFYDRREVKLCLQRVENGGNAECLV
ncbi:hypothetical protein MFRU_016g00760 [Monilinia fructicola]|nr:hypothetical protein MFRU_016g00760 [Monilinia fructicola]